MCFDSRFARGRSASLIDFAGPGGNGSPHEREHARMTPWDHRSGNQAAWAAHVTGRACQRGLPSRLVPNDDPMVHPCVLTLVRRAGCRLGSCKID